MHDGETDFSAVMAMHDRSTLGLDASARVGDVLNEVVAMLRHAPMGEHIEMDDGCSSYALWDASHVADWLLREFTEWGSR
jgi:hypothetical protein